MADYYNPYAGTTNAIVQGLASQGQPELMPGSPSTLGQLLFGTPKKPNSMWNKPGGKALGDLLGMAAMAVLGAGIGGLGGGRKGAAVGAQMGLGTGLMTTLGQRKAASEAPTNLMKQQVAAAGQIPSSAREFELANQNPAYMKFLKDMKINPISLGHLDIARAGEKRRAVKAEIDLKADSDAIANLQENIKHIYTPYKEMPWMERAKLSVPGSGFVSTAKADLETTWGLTVSNLARFGGQRGVLTDQDLELVQWAKPHELDSPDVLVKKEQTLNRIFNKVKTQKQENIDIYNEATGADDGLDAELQKRGLSGL